MAACEVGKEAIWLRELLAYLFENYLGPTVINCDNQSCIKMSGDIVFHSRKNISIISSSLLGTWCRMGS